MQNKFFFDPLIKNLLKKLLLLFLAIIFLGITDVVATEKLSKHQFKYDKLQRSYYLYLPANIKHSSNLPLLLVLHGGGKADGKGLAKQAGFNSLADKQGFIVAYPNGIDSQWNDGRGQTYREKNNTRIDDVGFISQLIDQLINDYPIDPNRVYVTGLSNGGMMTERLGCELSGKLAAIAPVISNLPKNIVVSCQPKNPLPVLLMNGTADPLVPWAGGNVHFYKKNMGEVVSTEETFRFWAHHNHCDQLPESRDLADINTRDGSSVKRIKYSNQGGDCDVQLYAIEGGGHNFPGSKMLELPRITGRKNMDIDAAAIIWAFLSRHTRYTEHQSNPDKTGE